MNRAESIKARLQAVSKLEGRPYDYLLMHYFIERFLYRLSVSRYASRLILKGGLFLVGVLELDARATRDVDLLALNISNNPEQVVEIFREICEIDAKDGVLFDAASVFAQRIKEDARYEGLRIKLFAYLARSRHVLQFDIGFDDVVTPHPMDFSYPSLLGMENPRLKAYSVESVLAEKFEAMIVLAQINSRMKDFYDVYILCSRFDFNGTSLLAAIRQTFGRRHTQTPENPAVFENSFFAMPEKQRQWDAFLRRIQADSTLPFEQVMTRLTTFLQPLYVAVCQNAQFDKTWSKESLMWNKTDASV